MLRSHFKKLKREKKLEEKYLRKKLEEKKTTNYALPTVEQ